MCMGHFHHHHQHSSSWYDPLPRLTVTSLVVKWKSADGEAEEVLVVCFVAIVHHIFIVIVVVIVVIALWHLSTIIFIIIVVVIVVISHYCIIIRIRSVIQINNSMHICWWYVRVSIVWYIFVYMCCALLNADCPVSGRGSQIGKAASHETDGGGSW